MQQSNTLPQGIEQLSMPIKVTDCIFMGDSVIAHDIEWLSLNQITHIINCAGRHCQNNTTIKGMCFLTFDWVQSNIQSIIDQNVINAVVGFIEEVRQQHGTVLIHGWRSDSRPFCLIAIYFMIKYQWSIFKTLEYLNSRKEGTEVDQAFIHQLNSLHSKLNERGLIKTKQWNITADTPEDQILLTNTFLNSRRRQAVDPQKIVQKKRKNMKSLAWKQHLSVEHVYSSATTVAQLTQPAPSRPALIQQKPRSQSVNSRKQDIDNVNNGPKSITGKILVAKQAMRADKTSAILTQMNVTKKWTQLRESWMKEKQNLNTNQPTCTYFDKSEVSRNSETPLYLKKQQRINDRLQDKINILKNQVQTSESNKQIGQIVQQRINKDSSINSIMRKSKEIEVNKKQKQNKKQTLLGLLSSEEGKDSRIIHNNWIINNQVLKQTGQKSQKQLSNKSVIVVKPNHALQPTESQPINRTSVRKAGSERKPQKEQQNKKFFGQQKIVVGERGRCNSVKQQRKDGLGNSMIMKNSSLTGKGKWKM